MPNDILTLRSSTPGARPTGRKPGELYVNWPDRQIGVVDAAGLPMDLTAIRQWSDQATYVQNDVVLYDGQMFICTGPTSLPPDNGKFRVKDWAALTRKMLLAPLDLYVDTAGNDDTGDGSAAAPWATSKALASYLSKEIDFNGRQVDVHYSVGVFDALVFGELVGEGGLALIGAGVDQTILNDGVATLYSKPTISITQMTVQMGGLTFMFSPGDAYLALGGPLALDFTAATFSASIANVVNNTLSCYGDIEVRQSGRPSNYYPAIFLNTNRAELIDQARWNLIGAPNAYPSWIASEGGRWTRFASATYTGTIVGKKYDIRDGSFFDSAGGGLDILPGDQPGTCDATSTYDGVSGAVGENPIVIDGGTVPYADTVKPGSATLALNKGAAGTNDIVGMVDNSTRWTMTLGNDAPEGGGGIGSEFTLNRWDDAGKHLGPVLRANRATGLVTVAGDPVDPLGVATKQMIAVAHWSSAAAYAVDDVVLKDGQLFVCIVPTSGPPEDKLFRKKEWSALTRRMLRGPLELYIDAAGNDDTGDGSQAKPWATSKAVTDYLAKEIDFNGRQVTVHYGVGTFEALTLWEIIGAGGITFTGAGVDQTFLKDGIIAAYTNAYMTISINKMTVQMGDLTFMFTSGDAFLGLGGPLALDFTAATNSASIANIGAGGTLSCYGDIEVRQNGLINSYYPAIALNGLGSEFNDQAKWNLTGAPNIYSAWIGSNGGRWKTYPSTTYTGSIIGKKFNITNGSIFDSNGAGVDFLPGDQPGAVDPTSFYDGVVGTSPYVSMDSGLRRDQIMARLTEEATQAPAPKTPPPKTPPPSRTPSRR